MRLTSKIRFERDPDHPFTFHVYLDDRLIETFTLLRFLGMKDDTHDRKN